MQQQRPPQEPAPAFTEREVLERISAAPHARAGLKQLIREMRLKEAGRKQLERCLKRLAAQGQIVELRSGHYAVTHLSREYAAGRVSVHRDGYGFLIPDHPAPGVEGDVFLPPATAGRVMHGDRALVRILRRTSDGRAEGEIVRVLARAHPTVVGEFRVLRSGCFVIPFDERILHWIEIPEGLELPLRQSTPDRIGAPQCALSSEDLDRLIVDVEILDYPDVAGGNAVGRVIEVLGHREDFGVDVEIMIRKHHLPHRFPADVLEQAQRTPAVIPAAEYARRRDFRSLDIITIDGETARDFDDAVWAERLPNGNYELQVHIADVGYYVQPGTPIDREAMLRGTSVYFPDRAVPMLPLELSTGVCSLLPGLDRLVLSVLLEIDRRGRIVHQEFVRGVIRSAERMTYANVHLILEGDPGLRERYSRLTARLELMRELALLLNHARTRRGSIDFDLPEPILEFDAEGRMVGISRSPRNIAHRIIEEFMLAANEAVASRLAEACIPSVYRIHEAPDPKRVAEFEDLAAQFGYSLGVGAIPVRRFPAVDRKSGGRKVRRDIQVADERLSVSSRAYQKLLAQLEGKPEQRILNYLLLRSLKQARYSARNAGHFALAADCYTHFTSPIRRYPDLVVHRVLTHFLETGQAYASEETLEQISAASSLAERRADEAERELIEWKKIQFMAGRVGDEFDALIVNASKGGLHVELDELFVEGWLPLDALPGDLYLFHENARQVVGRRTRRVFKIGQAVKVRLDRVDGMERRLYFSMAEDAPAAGRGRRRSRARQS